MDVAHRRSREWCHRTGKQNFIKFQFFSSDYYIFCIWYFFTLSSLPSHSFEINYSYHLRIHSRVIFTWSLSLTSTSSTLHTLISSSMNSTTFSFLSLIFLYSYIINIPHYIPVIFSLNILKLSQTKPAFIFPDYVS